MLVAGYVVLFCGIWLGIYGYLIWTHYRLPRFTQVMRHLPEQADEWPLLSVIVPACNEAGTIEAALRSLLAQDYPALQIIAVNDRSVDATGAILDRMAQQDPRLCVVHINQLPAGWLGKVHALHSGVQQAQGQWWLFADADVHFAPGALRRAIRYVYARRLDHLALLPNVEQRGFWLDVCVRTFSNLFFLSTRAASLNEPDSRRFIGVGAFNLVRAAVFQSTPGFAWLRLELADDVGVGMLMKQAGAACGFAVAEQDLSVLWYPDLAAMFNGLEKNLFGVGARFLWWRLVGQVTGIWGLLLAPWVGWVCGIAQGSAVLLSAAAATTVLQLVFSLYCIFEQRRETLRLLLFPVGMALLSFMMLRSAYQCLKHGGIRWRGTLYPLAQLREGQRVKL